MQQLENAKAHFDNGNALASQGHYKEAEAEFRTSLQYQPDNPVVEQNLSHVMELEAAPAPVPSPAPNPSPHKSR